MVKHLFSSETSKETFIMADATEPKKGMSMGAKFALFVLVLLILASVGIGIYFFIRRSRSNRQKEELTSD
jgi:flagellar basal body-associated protein FliL